MKSEWAKVPIESICQGIYDGPHATPAPSDNGAIFLGISNFVNGRLNFSDIRYIAEEDLPKWTKRVTPQAHDIVFSYEATLNLYAIIPEGFRGCLGRRMALMRPDESKVDYRYLYYYMYSPAWRAEIEAHKVMGSTVDRIPLIYFPSFTIELPSMTIQRRIADILSALDDKIELNQKVNENLERQAQAIFESWFTGKREINGCLADICQYSKEKVAVSSLDLESYYSTENMLSGKAGATQAANLPTTIQTIKCNVGDVLISNIRPYFKKIVYCHADCGCSTDVLCFAPKKQELSAYLFFLLYADSFFDFMVAGSKGTKMPRGDKQQIMMYPVYVPSDEELVGFNGFAQPTLKQVQLNREENKRLIALRDAFLPKLMAGEIRAFQEQNIQ